MNKEQIIQLIKDRSAEAKRMTLQCKEHDYDWYDGQLEALNELLNTIDPTNYSFVSNARIPPYKPKRFAIFRDIWLLFKR